MLNWLQWGEDLQLLITQAACAAIMYGTPSKICAHQLAGTLCFAHAWPPNTRRRSQGICTCWGGARACAPLPEECCNDTVSLIQWNSLPTPFPHPLQWLVAQTPKSLGPSCPQASPLSTRVYVKHLPASWGATTVREEFSSATNVDLADSGSLSKCVVLVHLLLLTGPCCELPHAASPASACVIRGVMQSLQNGGNGMLLLQSSSKCLVWHNAQGQIFLFQGCPPEVGVVKGQGISQVQKKLCL